MYLLPFLLNYSPLFSPHSFSLILCAYLNCRSRRWWVVGQPSRRRSWSFWLAQMGVDCSLTWPGVTITLFRLRVTLTTQAQDRPVRWPWSGTEHCLGEAWVLAQLNTCFFYITKKCMFLAQLHFCHFSAQWVSPSVETNSLTSYALFPIICSPSRRSPSCSWSLTAQVPAQATCPVWPVYLTSLVAGARLCPAACCGTTQTSSPALRERRGKAREKVSAICCWHPSTAPCVKSTETAPLVLRYITDHK